MKISLLTPETAPLTVQMANKCLKCGRYKVNLDPKLDTNIYSRFKTRSKNPRCPLMMLCCPKRCLSKTM